MQYITESVERNKLNLAQTITMVRTIAQAPGLAYKLVNNRSPEFGVVDTEAMEVFTTLLHGLEDETVIKQVANRFHRKTLLPLIRRSATDQAKLKTLRHEEYQQAYQLLDDLMVIDPMVGTRILDDLDDGLVGWKEASLFISDKGLKRNIYLLPLLSLINDELNNGE